MNLIVLLNKMSRYVINPAATLAFSISEKCTFTFIAEVKLGFKCILPGSSDSNSAQNPSVRSLHHPPTD